MSNSDSSKEFDFSFRNELYTDIDTLLVFKYINFVTNATFKYASCLTDETDLSIFHPVKLLSYLLENFDFRLQYMEHNVGLTTDMEKELFCRREIDKFPWFLVQNYKNITDTNIFYNTFTLYFESVCIDYYDICWQKIKNCKNKKKYGSISDILELIADCERKFNLYDLNYNLINIGKFTHVYFPRLSFYEETLKRENEEGKEEAERMILHYLEKESSKPPVIREENDEDFDEENETYEEETDEETIDEEETFTDELEFDEDSLEEETFSLSDNEVNTSHNILDIKPFSFTVKDVKEKKVNRDEISVLKEPYPIQDIPNPFLLTNILPMKKEEDMQVSTEVSKKTDKNVNSKKDNEKKEIKEIKETKEKTNHVNDCNHKKTNCDDIDVSKETST